MTVAVQSPVVLDRLANVSIARGAPDLGQRLAALDRWVRADLVDFEAELALLPRGARVVQEAAHHLLDLRGKHLRPTCVALASRFGSGFLPRARGLAVAVELVHTATLLHDDVVDLAERRRGEAAACVVYGNAASIFAGDWLLVAALRRIAAAGVDGLLDKMLGVIDDMILAESLQLERRGRVVADRDEYFRIVEGKTASLFRWAMLAGARSAELGAVAEHALDRYGLHLGVAFQAIDDELDFRTGTGKDPLVDLREGKMTFPLVVALERDPALRARIEAALECTDGDFEAIATAVRATGALTATRLLAEDHANRALEALALLPTGPARDALETVVLASLEEVMTELVKTEMATLPQLGSGQMFDRIAPRYDFVNRVLSLGLDQRWRRRVVRELGLGKRSEKSNWFGARPRVLDVATGTGDLAITLAMACAGATVIGIDPSANMLAIARDKIAKRGLADRVTLVEGDAQALPQKNCEIDAATIAFGIRNVPDRARGLRELARVVRPGGRIAVLELGEPRPGPLGAMARLHCHHLVPRIGALLSGSREYAYLQKSVAAFPPPDEFAALMRANGLDVLEIIPLTFGVCTLFIATPAEEM